MSVEVGQELATEVDDAATARLPTSAGDIVADKYEVECVLGTGGMGVVVAAVHLDLHEKVAIKFMLPEMAVHPAAANRFLREAQATSRLKSERVARLHDVGKLPDGTPFMVMELLEGETLDRVMQREAQIETTRLVDIVLQACEPLDEAHRIGIVHRDVKPENLFLAQRVDEGPIVKVLDFGISKVQSSISITLSNGMMGTASYSSPEQLKNASEVGPSADVWSLGVILFEGLTGAVPFSGASFAEICASVLHETPARARHLRPGLPHGLDAVVARCIDRHAPDRILTVPELAAGLAPFASEEGFALATRIMKRSSNRPEGGASWPPPPAVEHDFAPRLPPPPPLPDLGTLSLSIQSPSGIPFSLPSTAITLPSRPEERAPPLLEPRADAPGVAPRGEPPGASRPWSRARRPLAAVSLASVIALGFGAFVVHAGTRGGTVSGEQEGDPRAQGSRAASARSDAGSADGTSEDGTSEAGTSERGRALERALGPSDRLEMQRRRATDAADTPDVRSQDLDAGADAPLPSPKPLARPPRPLPPPVVMRAQIRAAPLPPGPAPSGPALAGSAPSGSAPAGSAAPSATAPGTSAPRAPDGPSSQRAPERTDEAKYDGMPFDL